MKRTLLVVLGLIGLLLLTLLLVPVLFKDKIQAQVQAGLDKALHADVYFDADNFSLSLLRHFPNASVSLSDFGIVNREPFAGDTLLAVDDFEVVVDLTSLFGDQIKVRGVELTRPRVFVEVLSDGRANYDIAVVDTTAAVDTVVTPTEFSVAVREWNITDGEVIYIDNTLPMYAHLVGLNHRGSGDFTQDVFDLSSSTEVGYLTVEYDTVEYLDGVALRADVDLNMNLPEARYTFRENTVRLNDFAFGFDGTVAMPTDAVDLDLTFQARETAFKNLLSLVPGVFTEGYEDLETSGQLAFDGYAKGTLDSAQIPGFGLNLAVQDGLLRYPDLPQSVSDVNIELKVDNPSGDLNEILIDLKQMTLKMGNDPLRARARVQGLEPTNLDVEMAGNLDLGALSQTLPLEGTTLRGALTVDAQAKGQYSDSLGLMPTLRADLNLREGYVKAPDLPAPLENVVMRVGARSEGSPASTQIDVENFQMTLDGERFVAEAFVENLDDIRYEAQAKGTLDLTKLTEMFPVEGTTLGGRVQVDIQTTGTLADVEAERYDRLPTSGTANVRDLTYRSTDLPHGVSIAQADLTFNPERLQVSNFSGTLGQSDVRADGYVANYLGYLFANQTLRGQMSVASRQFNVNEWLTDEPAPDTASAQPIEPIEFPTDIDFVLSANVDKVLYDNLVLENATGNVVVRNGAVRLDGLRFNTLGGTIVLNGAYDTQQPGTPRFDFGLGIDAVSVRQAYDAFVAVQKLAPIAKRINGNFSTDFQLGGQLDEQMAPVYSTLTGGGLIRIAQAAVQNLNLISKVNAITKLDVPTEATLRDVAISASVRDGRAFFEPFDFEVAGNTLTLGGSQGLDGTVDYRLSTAVPTGAVGQAANSAISSVVGQDFGGASEVDLNFGVGGTFDDLRVRLLGAEGSGLKDTAKDAVNDAVDDAKERAQAEAERLKQEAEARARQEAERAKQEAEERAREEAERLREEAEKRAREEAKKAADRLKDKIRFP